ncbi:ribonuclease H-like domain-containing protein [Maridesulfovibrio ferrireducens]|uniref:ribonuclease H-like domain-containing protein n=1 Tax=Maridesulfovibrio ferrireducens TaxID=246191 RepID=UPI001A27E6BD|nr:ribonuclease H-like domain-containing protein [Maridesulfovibrio ferrireducens]MBI9112133.1 ribonuclease H-like domain-containing protein [Maridesulfovibrio ferrireducens]
MLERTFCHLKGIGNTTEAKIWESGVSHWNDILEGTDIPFSPAKVNELEIGCGESLKRLKECDPIWFADRLPASDQWRLYPHFRKNIAYIDIETTGTDAHCCDITTIALWNGREVKTYVQGRNLHEFEEEIAKYQMIVSFNGKCFDVPFIEKYFGIKVKAAHIDLRFVFRSLGITGGLKGIEHYFGMDRGDAEGLDGYFAVLLWNEYEMSGNEKALETLLAYNVLDSVNLENLMIRGYNLHIERFPQHDLEPLSTVPEPLNPFKAHIDVVESIRRRYPSGGAFRKF